MRPQDVRRSAGTTHVAAQRPHSRPQRIKGDDEGQTEVVLKPGTSFLGFERDDDHGCTGLAKSFLLFGHLHEMAFADQSPDVAQESEDNGRTPELRKIQLLTVLREEANIGRAVTDLHDAACSQDPFAFSGSYLRDGSVDAGLRGLERAWTHHAPRVPACFIAIPRRDLPAAVRVYQCRYDDSLGRTSMSRGSPGLESHKEWDIPVS